jgi:hypothetical protein
VVVKIFVRSNDFVSIIFFVGRRFIGDLGVHRFWRGGGNANLSFTFPLSWGKLR